MKTQAAYVAEMLLKNESKLHVRRGVEILDEEPAPIDKRCIKSRIQKLNELKLPVDYPAPKNTGGVGLIACNSSEKALEQDNNFFTRPHIFEGERG